MDEPRLARLPDGAGDPVAELLARSLDDLGAEAGRVADVELARFRGEEHDRAARSRNGANGHLEEPLEQALPVGDPVHVLKRFLEMSGP